MNNIISRIFKNKILNTHKLANYGFSRADGAYCYRTEILNGQFVLDIKISQSDITTRVTEKDVGEEYSLFLVEGASGSFVGAVRAEYEKALTDIAENCFDKYIFKCGNSNRIIEYVREKYGDELEFLWEKFSDNAVWRRKDNKKWYGALLTVNKSKLGLPVDGKTEILDLRTEPDNIESVVDGEGIFKGYHMNKKSWISVLLDGTVDINKIYPLIDESYILANKKKRD